MKALTVIRKLVEMENAKEDNKTSVLEWESIGDDPEVLTLPCAPPRPHRSVRRCVEGDLGVGTVPCLLAVLALPPLRRCHIHGQNRLQGAAPPQFSCVFAALRVVLLARVL